MADPFGAVGMSARDGRGAVTAAVTAVVLVSAGLAGCSSRPARPFTPVDLPADGRSSSPEAGAAAETDPTAEPTAGSTAGPATGVTTEPMTGPAARVETVRVEPGVRVVIEWPATADPDTIGMINAFRDYFTGSFRAVVTGGRDTAYLETVQDTAGRDAYSWVREFLDQRRAVRGTARLYALNVASVTGPGAQLDVCVDESGMRLVDSGTGKAVRDQPDWTRKPFLQVAGVRRGDDGVWRIKLLRHAELPSEAVKGCLR